MTNIMMKNERRWLIDEEGQQQPLAMVAEALTENPAHPSVFVIRISKEPLTRPELTSIKELLESVLKDAPESRIIPVPPGARLPTPPKR